MNAERVAEGLLIAGAVAVAAGVWLLAGFGFALLIAGAEAICAGALIALLGLKGETDAGS